MSLTMILLTAVGLAMDAFAVAVCKGLAMPEVEKGFALRLAAYFGGFQALMPLLGWLLGSRFAAYVQRFAPWIAFGLLAFIGANMLRESFSRQEGEDEPGETGRRELLLLALATSIDALAVGVTFSMLELAVSVWGAFVLIGIVTFCISLAGVWVGCSFGRQYKSRAEFVGGCILILIGLKVLLEHLFG